MINEWSDKMVRRFAQLHRQTPELSFEMIASKMSEEFGITLTRNACIGKARRLGLPMRGKQQQMQRFPIEKRVRMMKVKTRVDAPIEPVEARLPDLVLRSGVTILQLRDDTCKWPLGKAFEKPPFLYCGHKPVTGRPYCVHHCSRAYNR